VHPQERVVTNIPRAQVAEAIRELEQSIEVDRAEIGHYQILGQTLSATSVRASDGGGVPRGVELALREKDEATKVLWGLIQKEYEEINGKLEVVDFLKRLLVYAT
jgi:hypothetical protein